MKSLLYVLTIQKSRIMKKMIILTAAVVIFLFTTEIPASAQRFPVFANISVGPSIPVGDFSNSTYPDGGYANTGVVLMLNGGVLFGKNFGVEILATATYNNTDDPYWAGDGSYTYNSIMAGPVASFPLSKSFSVDVRPSIGYTMQQIKLGFATDTYGEGFSYSMGSTLRYFFSANWVVVLNLDYFHANINYNYDYGRQKVETVNITVGAGFVF